MNPLDEMDRAFSDRPHYILDGTTVLRVSFLTWARWMEQDPDQRIIKQEDVGDYWVSTVFLGIDHSWGDGPPILFETMVFRRKPGGIDLGGEWQDRCSTYAEAEAMHKLACDGVRAGKIPDTREPDAVLPAPGSIILDLDP
jgi:hypothetical protein